MPLCVGDVVARLFVNLKTQTIFQEETTEGWPPPPDFPPDLFAAAAYLLETAGAYQHSIPGDETAGWPTSTAFPIGERGAQELVDAGAAWSRTPQIPDVVRSLWKELGLSRGQPVYAEHRIGAATPTWWLLALKLMVIADEACADVGYGTTRQFATGHEPLEEPTWIAQAALAPFDSLLRELAERNIAKSGTGHLTFVPQESSICQQVDPDVACVQPKSRTPGVGCTLRTLSHNLALLPPRGTVRATWQRPPWPLTHDDQAPLNLLLIPYPFHVSATAFRADYRVSPTDAKKERQTPWGWFDLKQQWLLGDVQGEEATERERQRRVEALATFTIGLVAAAKRDVGSVHGVVFPEYSLDWDCYELLVERIRGAVPEIEFLVAGSSSNCRREKGNMALSTAFEIDVASGETKRMAISTSRTKHHRWRLESTQVSGYALASALDPRAIWWERAPLLKREIHVNAFRGSSTFVTMICEDLARMDPCHAVLRSVAPSLVFVLLMDGPQLANRWPTRYATTLADDPGSSVLTFTSFALIDRSNRTRQFPECRNVALWKDDTGVTVPIPLDHGAQGILLTLSGHRTSEATMDGRLNLDGRAWRYHGHQPVVLGASSEEMKEALTLVMD